MMAAEAALMSHCSQQNLWEEASNAWMCNMIPDITVIEPKDSVKCFVTVGKAGLVALIVWEVEKEVPKVGPTRFHLKSDCIKNDSITFFPVLTDDACTVTPVNPLCPASQFITQGKRLSQRMGMIAHSSGPTQSILKHAASKAFMILVK